MTTMMPIQFQASLLPAPLLAAPLLAEQMLAPSAHEQIGFELGWDCARHAFTPPAPYGSEASPLRDGLQAGRAAFGARALQPTRPVQQWLQLRLHAWLHGRSVELFQVTPNYLQQIAASHCPITRSAMAADSDNLLIDRVRHDAAYAAGNLVAMSTAASHAKAAIGYREAMARAERIEADGLAGLDGLSAAAWRRMAALCSYVEPMPHDEACAVPMRVLPPNRLRLFNPVQALQAMLSRQLLRPGWSQRVSHFEELLPGKALQRDAKQFFMALLPRVLEAGPITDSQRTRWAIEDAWATPLVQRRWTEFARQLTPAQCEALLERTAKAGLAVTHIEASNEARATDGWSLETRGYVAHRPAPEGEPAMHQPLLC